MPQKRVGKLVRCMYGTRDAGAIWETCYTDCLVGMGFVQGVASPRCFEQKARKVSVVVNGDYFTALGNTDGPWKYTDGMTKTFECKLKGRLGRGKDDLKDMRVPSRIVRIADDGLRYEADPRHAELLAKSLNLENCKFMVTPVAKLPVDNNHGPDKEDVDDDEESKRSMRYQPRSV